MTQQECITSLPVVNKKRSAVKTKGRKKWKKPKDKPNRPLSAYNIFFRNERAKLMQEIQHNQKNIGKVGFAPLAKHIAAKWKQLDKSSRKIFEAQAEIEQQRYKVLLEEWKRKQGPSNNGSDHSAISAVPAMPDSFKPKCGENSRTDLTSMQERNEGILAYSEQVSTPDISTVRSNVFPPKYYCEQQSSSRGFGNTHSHNQGALPLQLETLKYETDPNKALMCNMTRSMETYQDDKLHRGPSLIDMCFQQSNGVDYCQGGFNTDFFLPKSLSSMVSSSVEPDITELYEFLKSDTDLFDTS